MNHPDSTLPQLLERSAAQAPGQPALIYLDQTITYGELMEHVLRAAAGLQALGVRPGDRVALMIPNCPQFVIAYFGALRAGAIVTATSPIYTAREAAHQWHDADVRVVIADAKLALLVSAVRAQCSSITHTVLTDDGDYAPTGFDMLQAALRLSAGEAPRGEVVAWADLLRTDPSPQPVTIRASDIACLQYTGGTTGTSKGAMLTHANFAINIVQVRDRLTDGRGGPEFSVAALPLFHIFAMTCVMLSALESGGTVLILPRFEAQAALMAIRRHRPAFFHGVPTMYLAFLNTPGVSAADFSSFCCCVCGGAPAPLEMQRQFEALLTNARLAEGYGLSEASPVTHFNSGGNPRAGTVGRPVLGTVARIVDLDTGTRELPDGEPGEIVIQGPQVMLGYWKKPTETAATLRDGWLHTGDIGRRDAEGCYTIVDRKKDLIIASGYNIYPREVEEVLFEHPAVREAMVIGVPDSYRGETVKAFIVPKPGAAPTSDEIGAFCRERLASYKVPRLVVFRESLPKSGVGKLLRRELRREEAEAQARNPAASPAST